MKKIIHIFFLLVVALSFGGCYHHHGYYGHPYYYTTYPVVYEYVPVSPVVQQVLVVVPSFR